MDDIDPDKLDAVRERLELEREQRLAEKVEAGELVSVVLSVVVGTASQIAAAVEAAKTAKLKELRDAGETREVTFRVHTAVTGVCRPGEAADPASVPTAPSFASREDAAIRRPLPRPAIAPVPEAVVEEVRTDPVVESYVWAQVRRCTDNDDPGEIAEGWFSIDGSKVVTVTNKNGKYVGRRAMLEGEDARVVAKQLLREKTPESENFNRRLSYPNAGLA
jgi:hypothetical protein